jgi:hypothetical protein
MLAFSGLGVDKHRTKGKGISMQGAEQVGLDGVFHSMSKGSRDWPIEHRWYGSEDVLDHWAHFLV